MSKIIILLLSFFIDGVGAPINFVEKGICGAVLLFNGLYNSVEGKPAQ